MAQSDYPLSELRFGKFTQDGGTDVFTTGMATIHDRTVRRHVNTMNTNNP